MRIVHASDWHGEVMCHDGMLPEADLYVFTGDMLDNHPIPDPRSRRNARKYAPDWIVHPPHEQIVQAKAIANFVKNGGLRRYLGSPDAPIVCVRGNHDFVEIAGMFDGCNLIQEFSGNELVEVLGLRITGHRGIPHIYGTWNDEVSRDELMQRVRDMPVADVYVTHYAPAGVLDHGYGLIGMGEELGARGNRFLHCFGHIHECGGQTRVVGDCVFSNAALSVNVIEWSCR